MKKLPIIILAILMASGITLAEAPARTVYFTLDSLMDGEGRFAINGLPWSSTPEEAGAFLGVPVGEGAVSQVGTMYNPGAYVHVEGLDEPIDTTYHRSGFMFYYVDGKLNASYVHVPAFPDEEDAVYDAVIKAYTDALGDDYITTTSVHPLHDGAAIEAGATEEEAYLGEATNTSMTWIGPGPAGADASQCTYLNIFQSDWPDGGRSLRVDIGTTDRANFETK